MSLFQRIFGDANERYIKALQPIVAKINSLEPDMVKLSKEEMLGLTAKFRKRLQKGETLDDLLPEAFAATREAAKRVLGQRHYDVQLMGGMVLHRGMIAEMRTGEGKTLVATLPLYLNALAGKGAHLITVNEYLAKRDCVWMGQIYHALGMSVGVIGHQSAFKYKEPQVSEVEEVERDRGVRVDMDYLEPITRRQAYECDILYGTNSEFGFDYLRDNMAQSLAETVQQPLAYVIVDEVDSILIDEARTPLIISAPAEKPDAMYYQFANLVRTLQRGTDYTVDEKLHSVTLTEVGMNKVERALGGGNIYETHGLQTVHHLESALKAEALYHRDKEYVVTNEGEVVIVDEFTGRMLPGRRFSEGLHQAIEAKENVKIENESVTLATITIQNYFRLYKKLSGMTGTAASAAEELYKIYKLEVIVVPTHQSMIRKDLPDRIFKTKRGKYMAVIKEVQKCREQGQPVLIGTASIEHNEELSELLTQAGIPHQLLNAKNHEKEATTIAQAGHAGAVTLATNMAGRGVDIILGGNPPQTNEADKVRTAGGLHVLGTERHEARRIDDQLRGRAGRQGDPGSSQFYVSLEDDLLRIFGSDRLKGLFSTLKIPEDMPLESKIVSKSLESAQKRVEGHNFDIRKHLVDYDDVINRHRESIYTQRRQILELSESKEINNVNQSTSGREEERSAFQNAPVSTLRDIILGYFDQEIIAIVQHHLHGETSEVNSDALLKSLRQLTPVDEKNLAIIKSLINDKNDEKLISVVKNLVRHNYDQLTDQLAKAPLLVNVANPILELEKRILLRAIDVAWIDHLEAMDHMRTGIGLRGYGQRDPLVEYKQEGFRLFHQLQSNIRNQVVWNLFGVGQAALAQASPMAKANVSYSAPSEGGESTSSTGVKRDDVKQFGHKVGRNDLCPCGSGKKYKKCHGK